MILAAGLGTRLKPLTDTMPKALVPVHGKPLLDLIIQRLARQGYTHFVVNVHHFAQQIINYLSDNYPGSTIVIDGCEQPLQVTVSDETQQLLETGGALKKAQRLFSSGEPILVHNVDILDNVDYHWFARQHRADEDAVLLVSRRNTKRYLLFDSAMRLMGWTNRETGEVKSPFQWLRTSEVVVDDALQVKTTYHPPLGSATHAQMPTLYAFAFSGIHSFSPRLFPLMERFPDRFSIIDFYLSVCHRSHIVGQVKDDLQVLDVGKPEALQAAASASFL